MKTQFPRLILLLATLITAASTFQAATAQPGAPAEEEVSTPMPEPEESEIYVDESGRRYRIIEYPKGREGVDHLLMPDGRVRIGFGMTLEIDHEDQRSFFLKVYLPAEPEARRPAKSDQKPPAAEASPPAVPVWPAVDRLTFMPFDDGLPRQGQWRDGFDLADMNDDGKVDIVFGPARKERPRPNVFIGDGAGSWRRWQAGFPALPYDYGDAAAADFNRDGHMDMALAIHLKGVLVLIGDGGGGFHAWSEGIGLDLPGREKSVAAFSSRAIEAVDWDGDGWTDLVALGEGPRPIKGAGDIDEGPNDSRGLVVYRNLGDGSWERLNGSSVGFGSSIALGDFDRDGRVDVLTASMVRGDRALLHLNDEAGGWMPMVLEAARPKAFVFSVASADLDRDGLDDILIGSISNETGQQRTTVDGLFAGDSGDWQHVALYGAPGQVGIYGLSAGDIDGDGRTDVAFGTGDGELHLLLGAAGRTFVNEQSPEIQQNRRGCHAYGLRLADLDGDGGAELLSGFAGERVSLEPIYASPGCPDGGSIRAWRATARDGDR